MVATCVFLRKMYMETYSIRQIRREKRWWSIRLKICCPNIPLFLTAFSFFSFFSALPILQFSSFYPSHLVWTNIDNICGKKASASSSLRNKIRINIEYFSHFPPECLSFSKTVFKLVHIPKDGEKKRWRCENEKDLASRDYINILVLFVSLQWYRNTLINCLKIAKQGSRVNSELQV